MLKHAVKAMLDRTPYTVLPRERLDYKARQWEHLVGQIHSLVRDRILTDLPDTPGQADLLGKLIGTDSVSGLFLVDAVHKALRVSGAICEFGVAEGATSALMANELLHHAPERTLWLYDSFEGLPKPSSHDVLLDDFLHLGSLESYQGQFAIPRTEVERRLHAIAWPTEQTRIVAGFFTPRSELPEQVAFAYVDFDFYEPIRDALQAVASRSRVGTIILVDDYGFFSVGAQQATDEFSASEAWELTRPPNYLAFATLERVS